MTENILANLFEYLGIEPVELETIRESQSPGVIHLSFRVCKWFREAAPGGS